MSSTFCPISQAPWRQQKFSSATAGLLLCLTLGDVQAQEMTIGNQLVEHRVAPVGLDALHPRFSWQLQGGANGLRQTAYQVQVALAADDLTAPGKRLAWDSGWVTSDQSHLVACAGEALRSSTPYFWRVRIKNEADVGNGFLVL